MSRDHLIEYCTCHFRFLESIDLVFIHKENNINTKWSLLLIVAHHRFQFQALENETNENNDGITTSYK